MYDLPGVEADVDALWAAIAERTDADPVRTRPDDLHRHWQSGEFVLSQTCGFPLVDVLDQLTVVGVFTTAVGVGDGSHYQSVIIEPFAPSSGPIAINSWDSLSGYVSLAHFLAADRPDVLDAGPVPTMMTGGHRHSLAAVASGLASLASIDAVTFDILSRTSPGAVAAVRRVGSGPIVPCLPLVVANDEHRARLSDVLDRVVQIESLQPALRRLAISGFKPLDRHAYSGLRTLITKARRDLPPNVDQ
jgi:ABC-type phosphate/phosphonate transport system substrate-binding protein